MTDTTKENLNIAGGIIAKAMTDAASTLSETLPDERARITEQEGSDTEVKSLQGIIDTLDLAGCPWQLEADTVKEAGEKLADELEALAKAIRTALN